MPGEAEVEQAAPDQPRRWQGRPVTSALLRAAVYSVPFALSVLAGVAVARVVAPPPTSGGVVVWVGGIFLLSSLVLWVVDRLARRLLPLAALLRVSMAFPDAAPSRFKVARLTRSTRELERRVARVRAGEVPSQPDEAATTILALVTALSEHDRRTRGHSERVRIFTDLVTEQLGLAPDARDKLRWVALVHDMGKLMVPGGVLNKAGKPTDDEWAVLRSHPEQGGRLCAALMPWLGEWGKGIVEHHERFDGSGYPLGLAGHDISLAGRVLTVADCYEVMTAARAYKRAMSAVAAREELTRCAGWHFDPMVVRAFLQISLTRLRLAMGPLSWLAQAPFLWRVPQLSQAAGVAGASVGGAAAIGLGTVVPSASGVTPAAAVVADGTATAATATASVVTAGTPFANGRTPGAVGGGDRTVTARSGVDGGPAGVPVGADTTPTGPTHAPTGAVGDGSPHGGDGGSPVAGPAGEDDDGDLGGDVDDTADGLGEVVGDTADGVGDTVEDVADVLDPTGQLGDAGDATVDGLGDAVEAATDTLGDVVDDTLGGLGDGDGGLLGQ